MGLPGLGCWHRPARPGPAAGPVAATRAASLAGASATAVTERSKSSATGSQPDFFQAGPGGGAAKLDGGSLEKNVSARQAGRVRGTGSPSRQRSTQAAALPPPRAGLPAH